MKFVETPLKGAWVIEREPRTDDRGAFSRVFCTAEFAEFGLHTRFVQHNLSESPRKGTLRGMHFQNAPHEEAKLVRCERGTIYDVIVDLRRSSPTFRKWFGVELDGAKNQMLYVPEGFAHGFLTLTNDVRVFYLHSKEYVPGAESGLRYDDPGIGIAWPAPAKIVSERDANLANFDAGHALVP